MAIRTATGAQRYNNRMDKVFSEAMAARKDPVNKSHRRHNQKRSAAIERAKKH